MEQPWTLLTEITAAFNSTATCTETCVKHQHYSSGSTPLIPDSATGRNINFVSFTSDSHYLSQENLRVPQYYPPISFPVSEVAVFEDVSPPKYWLYLLSPPAGRSLAYFTSLIVACTYVYVNMYEGPTLCI
jgi:hypothetical protein